MFSILIFGGCSGYGQKTNSDIPVESSKQVTSDDTPIFSDVKQNGTKPKPRGKTAKLSAKYFRDLDYLASLKGVEYIELARENKGGVPLPWDPLTVSVEVWISRAKRSRELVEARRTNKITNQEYNEQMMQFFRNNGENGLVTSMRQIIEMDGGAVGSSVSRLVNLAYAEDPDDFDTLLTWVYAGGSSANPYGIEKTEGTRRLYQMNPSHPWVLHKLAKCLLGPNPEEALIYARKAQELDPRYLLFGVEGLCYFQMGDYEKALEAFKRSQKAAVDTSNLFIARAISVWRGKAISGVNSDLLDRYRKAGQPVLGPDLPTPLRY